MAPIIFIIILAIIGATLDGFPGFLSWGAIAAVALLILGWLLRKMAPIPKITLVDRNNQTYTVNKGFQVQPYSREGNFLAFRGLFNGEIVVLTINLDRGLYSISRPIGTRNPGPIVEHEPYKNNRLISAVADYFSEKKDVWLSCS